jgi:hypothetical protein
MRVSEPSSPQPETESVEHDSKEDEISIPRMTGTRFRRVLKLGFISWEEYLNELNQVVEFGWSDSTYALLKVSEKKARHRFQ